LPSQERAGRRECGSATEVFNPCIRAGFTTAVVTDVSAAGWADGVKKNIEQLRGTVTCQTGIGSVFALSLPPMLAIIDGMVIRSGERCHSDPVDHPPGQPRRGRHTVFRRCRSFQGDPIPRTGWRGSLNDGAVRPRGHCGAAE
jgi:hypothetical protein